MALIGSSDELLRLRCLCVRFLQKGASVEKGGRTGLLVPGKIFLFLATGVEL